MFNGNAEGIASGCPCTRECPNRTPYCHGTCQAFKEWQIVQKHYSNKVKRIRKQMGGGIRWNQTKGNIRGSR
jgi:hypothetical protein